MIDTPDEPEDGVAVVIEDDHDIREIIASIIRKIGLTVIPVVDGRAGLEAVRQHDPQIVTVDLGLPGMDGFEVTRRIRAISSCHLIMITGDDAETDILTGLHLGANDYLVKPFRNSELRARIEAARRYRRLLRREAFDGAAGGAGAVTLEEEPSPGTGGDRGIRIDAVQRKVTVDGDAVDLTWTEFAILTLLASDPGRAYGRADIVRHLNETAGRPGAVVTEPDLHGLDAHLSNLRRKLHDNARRPRFIGTVRGFGYRFVSASSDAVREDGEREGQPLPRVL